MQEQEQWQGQAILLVAEDVRAGQIKYWEIARLHDLMHAAEADFGRWANGMAALYGVPPGYIIGDPLAGFVPAAASREGGGTNG